MIVDLSIQYHSYREKSIKREGKTLKLNYKRTFFIGLAFL